MISEETKPKLNPYIKRKYQIMREMDYRKAEHSLRHFNQSAFRVLETEDKYVHGWHIDYICEHLELVLEGKIKRLIINIGPRHMKSLGVTVGFPVWVWLERPGVRILCSSYSGELSTEHNVKRRRLIRSSWFQQRWGNLFKLEDDQDRKTEFENNRRGSMTATSTGGTTGGKGGNIIIADDSCDPERGESEAHREQANQHVKYLVSTRLNNPKEDKFIYVGQRLHENDCTQTLIDLWEDKEYTHLCLETEAETDHQVVFPKSGRIVERKEGDLLWPERFGEDQISATKKGLGTYGYAAQHQQRPVPAGGGIFKRQWWQYYNEIPAGIKNITWFWDTATKIKEVNDYSVGLCIGETKNGYYLIDCYRNRDTFPDLEKAVIQCNSKHLAREIIVEDKSSGQQIIQVLERETKLPVKAYKPDGDKVYRAHLVSPTAEAGKIFLPKDSGWVLEFIKELESFPRSKHDDQVDALTMGIIYFTILNQVGTLAGIQTVSQKRPARAPTNRSGLKW